MCVCARVCVCEKKSLRNPTRQARAKTENMRALKSKSLSSSSRPRWSKKPPKDDAMQQPQHTHALMCMGFVSVSLVARSRSRRVVWKDPLSGSLLLILVVSMRFDLPFLRLETNKGCAVVAFLYAPSILVCIHLSCVCPDRVDCQRSYPSFTILLILLTPTKPH